MPDDSNRCASWSECAVPDDNNNANNMHTSVARKRVCIY